MPTVNATVTPGAVAGYFSDIRAKLEKIRSDTMAAADRAMSNSMEQGVDVAHQRIEAAVTPTGVARAARGGAAGRIESSHMYDDFKTENTQVTADHLQGREGWLDGGLPSHSDPKSYYQLQDEGFQDVAGVHALVDAWTVAKAEFKKELTDYVRTELS